MKARRTKMVPLLGTFALLALADCSRKTRWFDTQVEISRMDVVQRDAKGKALTKDVEFSYKDCPGVQVEVVRGGAEFAECMDRYKIGEKVAVKIEYHWDAAGYWDWDIHAMGVCKRPPEYGDEASFDTVQECEDVVSNGAKVGFHCNRLPQKHLLQKCPWFGR